MQAKAHKCGHSNSQTCDNNKNREELRYIQEDGIKTDIRETALEGMDFIPAKFRVQIWASSLHIRTEYCYTFLILP